VRLTLEQIAGWSGARIVAGDPASVVDGAGVDSRDLAPGMLFVGLPGENDDGGRFAPAAAAAGAGAVLIGEAAWSEVGERVREAGVPALVAEDPLAALQGAGRGALARSGARVAAITGSTGKTTTKDILVAVLRAGGARAEGTPGNRNTEIGVPLSLLGLPDDVDVAVVEMGMRGEGQIAELARLAPPDVAVITSVGPVHLELLGTVERVAAAKAELIAALRPGGTAVVPEGELLLAPHVAALDPGVTVLGFGDDPEGGVEVGLTKAWQRRNAAAAVLAAGALGYAPTPGTVVRPELSAMRGQEWPLPAGGTLIEDCYNANPIAMRAALADLAGREGRRVAVLGDMAELGPDEARFHAEVGALVAELGIDELVAVGTRAGGYADAAPGVPAARYPDADAAAAALPARVRPGDVVLVKGSRSMELERVVAALRTSDPGTACRAS
jgi:UDP-N-acetylmuramoyl-tripeptide--D-alanyl-D-alanine ligase